MDIYEEIVQLRHAGRRGAIATIVNVRGSVPSFETAKMLVRDDGSIFGTIGGGCVEADVWQAARGVLESGRLGPWTSNWNKNPKTTTALSAEARPTFFSNPSHLPAYLIFSVQAHDP